MSGFVFYFTGLPCFTRYGQPILLTTFKLTRYHCYCLVLRVLKLLGNAEYLISTHLIVTSARQWHNVYLIKMHF
jgi:hypothetical protein